MKLMKHITIALVLCAIPAMAFGQTVSCDDCTHEVSVYMGGGGLIATADDADMVSYVATCGGSSRFDELAANDDGVVSMLFEPCLSEGGSFKIGPIMDGGWYWITDDMNSAVGNLVAMDILDNDTVDITDAGDSVDMTMGKGAVYLKHTSGRVGILPNILPEPPATPLRKCGFSGAATAASPAVPVNTGCALGDGGTTVLATSTNGITGATVRIMDKGSINRPGGTASVSILVDLWGNGSGHYVTTHDATTGNGVSAMLGQDAVALNATARPAARLTGVTYTVTHSTGGPGGGDEISSGTPIAGVDHTTDANALTITVANDPAYCSKTANHTGTVNVTALMTDETSAAQVTPSIKRNATTSAVGSMSFNVVCPSASASANQGQELVPENPFPTE